MRVNPPPFFQNSNSLQTDLVFYYKRLDQTDASISVGPETGAVNPDSGVPVDKVGDGGAPGPGDGLARIARLNEVIGLVVGKHAALDWRRCDDPVAAARRRGLRRSPRLADDAEAHVDAGPEAFAVAADARVPDQEMRKGNAVAGRNCATRVSSLEKIKLVIVRDHTGLRGLGSCNAIAWLRRCGSRRGRGSCGNLVADRGLARGLNTVGAAGDIVAAA